VAGEFDGVGFVASWVDDSRRTFEPTGPRISERRRLAFCREWIGHRFFE